MLTVIFNEPTSVSIDIAATLLQMRAATREASFAVVSTSKMINSSPPKREAVSLPERRL